VAAFSTPTRWCKGSIVISGGIYVPGCPPRPEQLLQSIIDWQDKIDKTGTLTGHEFAGRTQSEAAQTLGRCRSIPKEAMSPPAISPRRPAA